MSYSRFAWEGSEVYVFESSAGIECCGCNLRPRLAGTVPVFREPEEMIAHLAAHRRAGQYVPFDAIERLWCEIPGALRPSKPAPAALQRMEVALEKERLRWDQLTKAEQSRERAAFRKKIRTQPTPPPAGR